MDQPQGNGVSAANMKMLAHDEEARIAELAQYIPDFEAEAPQKIAEPSLVTDSGVFNPPEYRQPGNRQHPRYLVGWRVAIVDKNGENHHTFYGRAHDVSLGGANIWSEYNLRFSDSVILLLAMPSRIPGKRANIVEVSSRSMYTVLMANSPTFRIGFRFENFKTDNQKKLARYLQQVPRVTLSSK